MSYKFDVNKALELSGYNGQFQDSLKRVLKEINKDPNINNIKEASYLLATAKVESDYSLQRWEADYLCGMRGIAYDDKPCQRALDYYRSSNGKSNYYAKGVDKKGLPYFGRGLIQLTNEYNYKKYGDLIGVNLVDNADKALEEKNSYKIASEYLAEKTFKHVNNNDLFKARLSVNGANRGEQEVNTSYRQWLDILAKSKKDNSITLYTDKKGNKKTIQKSTLIIILSTTTLIGITLFTIFRGK